MNTVDCFMTGHRAARSDPVIVLLFQFVVYALLFQHSKRFKCVYPLGLLSF